MVRGSTREYISEGGCSKPEENGESVHRGTGKDGWLCCGKTGEMERGNTVEFVRVSRGSKPGGKMSGNTE